MHFYFAQHPGAATSFRQEVHYFDLNYNRGTSWYRAQFRRSPGAACTVDVTPYYLFHPAVPKRIAETLDRPRFVVLLRNPIDRAVSHYWNSIRFGEETLPLEDAFAAEEARLADSHERLREGRLEKHEAHRTHSYLSRGLYAKQLTEWFAHFDRDSFLILPSERLFRDTAETMDAVFRFAGLKPLPDLKTQAFNRNDHGAISSALRDRLANYYAEPNRQLEELLGQKFDW